MKNSTIIVSISAVVLAIGLLLTGCAATSTATITQTVTATPLEPFAQVLSGTIEPVTDPNASVTNNYVNYLRVGDQVTGVVQLTGLWEKGEHPWMFTIFCGDRNDLSNRLQKWQSGYLGDDKHAFGFTAQQDGEYTLQISVGSSKIKDLRIDITPKGWR